MIFTHGSASSFTPAATRQGSATANPASAGTANIGNLNSGDVLQGRGSDFLNPNQVQDHSNSLANSIRPITSNTTQAQLFGGSPFGRNPSPQEILNGTRSGINNALTFSLAFNPSNSNPLGWINPNSTDIILGSLHGQNAVFNGNPLFVPLPGQPPFQIPTSGVSVAPPGATGIPSGVDLGSSVPLGGSTALPGGSPVLSTNLSGSTSHLGFQGSRSNASMIPLTTHPALAQLSPFGIMVSGPTGQAGSAAPYGQGMSASNFEQLAAANFNRLNQMVAMLTQQFVQWYNAARPTGYSAPQAYAPPSYAPQSYAPPSY